MHLAKNIRYLRQEKNLTQEDIAAHIGKSKGNVSAYEKEKTLPPIDIILQLCELFNVTLDELVTRDLAREGYLAPPEETTAGPGQALFNRFLMLKLKEAARELKACNPEAYRRLKLDELMDDKT